MSSAAVLNYLINPYGLFPSSSISGFNLVKPKAGDRGRVIKPYQSLRVNPRTLIIGNSRPEMGLDFNHCVKDQIQPSYNLGIPGAGVYMQTRYAQHVMSSGSVKTILLGVDFMDFLVQNKSIIFSKWPFDNTDFDKWLTVDRFNEKNNLYLIYKAKNFLEGLFSLQSLMDSTVTLLSQTNQYSSTRRYDGFNPANEYFDIILFEGQGVLFKQKEQQLYKNFSDPSSVIFQGTGKWSVEFESIERFIKLAKKQEIQVILFINPYHVRYLNIIYRTRKWELLKEWKRTLMKVSERHKIPLWDFTGFNRYTSEKIPKSGDKKTILQWFWEPAHYKKELGDIMLSKMLPNRCPDLGLESTASFGTLINSNNIDEHLEKTDLALQKFVKNQ